MKQQVLLLAIMLSVLLKGTSQILTFTGSYQHQHVDLDAVIISNLMKDCDTILAWPDTILDLDALGIDNNFTLKPAFEVSQNTPNPVYGKTSIRVSIPFTTDAKLMISHISGKIIKVMERKMDRGIHYFDLSPGEYSTLLFTLLVGNEKRSIKIVSAINSGDDFRIEYKGFGLMDGKFKSANENAFTYSNGDMLEFKGIYDNQTMKLYDTPDRDSTYTFPFTTEEVFAAFSYQIDPQNPMKVYFTNHSQNADTYHWNFGDGLYSTEEHPNHIYPGLGNYVVTLTANNSGGTDFMSVMVEIENPGFVAEILTGGSEKTWKLIRDVSTGRYPLQVGPLEPYSIWWAFGLQEGLWLRPCMLNDEWTFKVNGDMYFEDNRDYWAEGSIYPDDFDDICSSSETMVNFEGTDVSAWSSGNHQWSYNQTDLLTVTGYGAYLGLCKAATDEEVIVPQQSVTYQIIKLTDGSTDTLVVQTTFTDYYETVGYWRFVLVHYDNPADEPPIPGPEPEAGFSYQINGNTVIFINESVMAEEYLWDFGDGMTSTEVNPVHTYVQGSYNISLTAINEYGMNVMNKMLLIGSDVVTDEILQGNAWKIKDAPDAIFVGPELGSNAWWSVPYEYLQAGGSWSCIMDDEFIFGQGGSYEYKSNGSAYNDGYASSPQGCFSDSELYSMGFPFLSALHSYVLVTEGDHQHIIFTNVPSQAAFIGFYKGYYGGENNSMSTQPNGGLTTNRYEIMGYSNNGVNETLFLSVDLNGSAPNGAAWSVILER